MIEKLIEILKINEVSYLPSIFSRELKNNNLVLKPYSYPGFDGFKDLLHVIYYSKSGLNKGWNEYFISFVDFTAKEPDLFFIAYYNKSIDLNHQNPQSSLRHGVKAFNLIFHRDYKNLNLTIAQSLRDFFHNSTNIYLGEFLQWFSFDHKNIYSAFDNKIFGSPKESSLVFIGNIESFSSAYYFLIKHGFIKDIIDEEGRLSHSTSRSYFGGLIRNGFEVESLNIGVAYAYYQGDNPRDGHATFKIDFNDLQNIRECYNKSYGIDTDDNNDLHF
ncbi:hypothetical protein GYM62_14915 [Algoriphagus sp. NBT04N3]|jgi:hypothetical protein|uniref:hypothetical protein n=1 Tax=Algoriphagus sp. NBT04N3 TaxID=2705473 RepID=UPI001C63767D|nr:hypothetical protein [Algoriphagus sp. NBT04N3]QYH40016.1 hypothetical protein GYM62_14915 [Algoriphagus sp. NBT04N3]